MQTYIVQCQFPSLEASMKATKTFTDYVKEGSPYDSFEGFKVLNRVLNPLLANGWAIVQALSVLSAILNMLQLYFL